jgi:hypothetical protein
MVTQAAPKTLPQKTMADPGEAAVNFPDPMAKKRFFLDHFILPDNRLTPNGCFHIGCHTPAGENDPQFDLFFHKNGNRAWQTTILQGRYHGPNRVLKMYHPWFFLIAAVFVVFPAVGGLLCLFLSVGIFVVPCDGLLYGQPFCTPYRNRPGPASNYDR